MRTPIWTLLCVALAAGCGAAGGAGVGDPLGRPGKADDDGGIVELGAADALLAEAALGDVDGALPAAADALPAEGAPDVGPPPPVCGDGTRDPAEECDDGNTENLDGCSAACLFEQVHRIHALKLEAGTSSFCSANAFGGAIGSAISGKVQDGVDAAIADGSMTVLLQFLALDALNGADDAALALGVMGGTPAPGPGYDGAHDLDWWYSPTAAHLDAARVPTTRLAATISNKILSAGPASMSLPLSLGATPSLLRLAHAQIRARIGATSAPRRSSAGMPPGHLAAEQLDPQLVSFATAGETDGRLCGRIPAASLRTMPIPEDLRAACGEGYSAANSLLDLLVKGCTVFLFVKAVRPTQPDTDDPDAAPAGAGPQYTLVPNAQTGVVDRCKDKRGAAVPLAACLADASYSASFSLASRRVIAR